MKTLKKVFIIILAVAAISLSPRSQNTTAKTNSGQTALRESDDTKSLTSECVPGVITIKLNKGVGEYGKQTGTVQFGVQSLDEKVAAYQVYQLEKRFRLQPG